MLRERGKNSWLKERKQESLNFLGIQMKVNFLEDIVVKESLSVGKDHQYSLVK
jgi:hypothetical protein